MLVGNSLKMIPVYKRDKKSGFDTKMKSWRKGFHCFVTSFYLIFFIETSIQLRETVRNFFDLSIHEKCLFSAMNRRLMDLVLTSKNGVHFNLVLQLRRIKKFLQILSKSAKRNIDRVTNLTCLN